MAGSLHILTTLRVPDAVQSEIRAIDGRVRLHVLSEPAARRFRTPDAAVDDRDSADREIGEAVARSEIWWTFMMPHERIPKEGPLRWIQLGGAGADWLLRAGAFPPGVRLTNSRGVAAQPIAEWVLTYCLMHAKRMPFFMARQREGVWRRTEATTLRGATVAVIGLGAIGTEVARLCQAFGARVIATRRSARPGDTAPHCDALYPAAALDTVLAEADYVAICVPLTPETRRFFGAAQFAAMRPTAALVNIGRGGTVDHDALAAALRAGEIAAAYLDVTDPEPLPDGHPLWGAPNLFVTPHVTGLFPNYVAHAARVFTRNLRHYFHGEALENLVDPSLGY